MVNVDLTFLKDMCKDYVREEHGKDFVYKDLHALYYTENMRDQDGYYADFFDRFVRQIVGKKEFDTKCLQWDETKSENEVATVSDEALALLCFENHFEVWQDVWKRSKGEIRPISKKDPYPEEWISDKVTKYTSKKDSKGKPVDTKDKSWTNEGFLRFNELFKLVKESREKDPDFFKRFIESKQGILKEASKKTPSSKKELPDVEDDLFHNPEFVNKESFTPSAAMVENDEGGSKLSTKKSVGKRKLNMDV